jgi:hypothetical protein
VSRNSTLSNSSPARASLSAWSFCSKVKRAAFRDFLLGHRDASHHSGDAAAAAGAAGGISAAGTAATARTGCGDHGCAAYAARISIPLVLPQLMATGPFAPDGVPSALQHPFATAVGAPYDQQPNGGGGGGGSPVAYFAHGAAATPIHFGAACATCYAQRWALPCCLRGCIPQRAVCMCLLCATAR